MTWLHLAIALRRVFGYPESFETYLVARRHQVNKILPEVWDWLGASSGHSPSSKAHLSGSRRSQGVGTPSIYCLPAVLYMLPLFRFLSSLRPFDSKGPHHAKKAICLETDTKQKTNLHWQGETSSLYSRKRLQGRRQPQV